MTAVDARAPPKMLIDASLRPIFAASRGYALVDAHQMRHSAWGSPAGCALIDAAGVRSAIAQGLKGPGGAPAPVTKAVQLHGSPQRLYLLATASADGGGSSDSEPSVLVGLLKVGEKNLYHWSSKGEMHNLQDMPCVLDFYVHEDFQRRGAGRALFDAMLASGAPHARVPPRLSALLYDTRRPTHSPVVGARPRAQSARRPSASRTTAHRPS